MKIALLGLGKMGKMVQELAPARHHETLPISRNTSEELKKTLLQKADIAIDFSHPSAVLPHLQLCIEQRINLVIGTTGWDEHLPEIKALLANSSIGCLYGPNFSIGIAFFKRIAAHAASLLAPDYDLAGIEYHHRTKVDAPSGTSKELVREISQTHPSYLHFQFSSVRCGHITGIHTLLFDSPTDTITLTHQSRHRQGYALGALKAAEWLQNKQGYYSFSDYLGASDHAH